MEILHYNYEELETLTAIFIANRAKGLNVQDSLVALFLAMSGELPKEIEEAQRLLYESQINQPDDYDEQLKAGFEFKYGATNDAVSEDGVLSLGSGHPELSSQTTQGTD